MREPLFRRFGIPGISRRIHLKYFTKFQNVGDQFSASLAKKVFKNEIIPCNELPIESKNLILVGSILQWADSNSIVCGAGFIRSEVKVQAKPKRVICVRGPLSAGKLRQEGIECPERYADPGVLAPALFPQKVVVRHAIGFVPHYWDMAHPFTEYCRENGVKILNVRDEPEVFFHQLAECEVVLSTSLHGLIFAHAYGKPALWMEISDKVIGGGFKFFDYYASLGVAEGRVNRQIIPPDHFPDLLRLAEMATPGNQQNLVSNMQESLQLAKHEFGSHWLSGLKRFYCTL